MDNLSDIEIIRSVCQGNQGDFALLVDRYKDRAFTLLKRMLKNRQDAEEVLQDSFLKVYRSLGSFRGDAQFSTWFYRIVYNSALTFLSGRRRREEAQLNSLDDSAEYLSDELSTAMGQAHITQPYDIHSLYETQELQRLLGDIIESLPPRYSAVISMFYMDQMSIEEISKATGNTVSNVKVMLHRSRTALRQAIVKSKYQEDFR